MQKKFFVNLVDFFLAYYEYEINFHYEDIVFQLHIRKKTFPLE